MMAIIGAIGFSISCDNEIPQLFTIEEEILLAEELKGWAVKDSTINVLTEEDYSAAYSYANIVFNDILELNRPDSASNVANRDTFQWSVFMIGSTKLDAFVTPGGYLFINTGLIKLLEAPDEFAAVLGHLIAHADQRHTSKQLLKYFSSEDLRLASNGNDPRILSEIAENIFGRRRIFSYSYGDERQCEQATVNYLSLTDYACNSSESVYKKLDKQEQQGNPPGFYNAHAFSGDRTAIINAEVQMIQCNTSDYEEVPNTFKNFQNSLP